MAALHSDPVRPNRQARRAAVKVPPSREGLCVRDKYLLIQFSNSACLQTQPRDLAARCARALRRLPPSITTRGRRESRVRAAPAVSCANMHKKTHTSIQVQRRHPGLPCAMVYGLLRALPGERLFLPPSSARSFASRELDASTAASGPHDFAVRAACVRLSQAPRPPHPTARFVTIASRPSHRVRQAKLNTDSPLREKRNIFILVLDINSENQKYCPSGCFVAAGSRDFACARGDAVRSA